MPALGQRTTESNTPMRYDRESVVATRSAKLARKFQNRGGTMLPVAYMRRLRREDIIDELWVRSLASCVGITVFSSSYGASCPSMDGNGTCAPCALMIHPSTGGLIE